MADLQTRIEEALKDYAIASARHFEISENAALIKLNAELEELQKDGNTTAYEKNRVSDKINKIESDQTPNTAHLTDITTNPFFPNIDIDSINKKIEKEQTNSPTSSDQLAFLEEHKKYLERFEKHSKEYFADHKKFKKELAKKLTKNFTVPDLYKIKPIPKAVGTQVAKTLGIGLVKVTKDQLDDIWGAVRRTISNLLPQALTTLSTCIGPTLIYFKIFSTIFKNYELAKKYYENYKKGDKSSTNKINFIAASLATALAVATAAFCFITLAIIVASVLTSLTAVIAAHLVAAASFLIANAPLILSVCMAVSALPKVIKNGVRLYKANQAEKTLMQARGELTKEKEIDEILIDFQHFQNKDFSTPDNLKKHASTYQWLLAYHALQEERFQAKRELTFSIAKFILGAGGIPISITGSYAISIPVLLLELGLMLFEKIDKKHYECDLSRKIDGKVSGAFSKVHGFFSRPGKREAALTAPLRLTPSPT